jgi:hypothetical protein
MLLFIVVCAVSAFGAYSLGWHSIPTSELFLYILESDLSFVITGAEFTFVIVFVTYFACLVRPTEKDIRL